MTNDDKFLREVTKAMSRKLCRHDIELASLGRTGPIIYPYCWHRPILRLRHKRLMKRFRRAQGRSRLQSGVLIIPDDLV